MKSDSGIIFFGEIKVNDLISFKPKFASFSLRSISIFFERGIYSSERKLLSFKFSKGILSYPSNLAISSIMSFLSKISCLHDGAVIEKKIFVYLFQILIFQDN